MKEMSDFKIYPSVVLGKGKIVEDYCVLGIPPRGKCEGELETRIGAGAQLRAHTVIYAGNRIGKNFQTGNPTEDSCSTREAGRPGTIDTP